jgi:hypothetical protein
MNYEECDVHPIEIIQMLGDMPHTYITLPYDFAVRPNHHDFIIQYDDDVTKCYLATDNGTWRWIAGSLNYRSPPQPNAVCICRQRESGTIEQWWWVPVDKF